MSSPPPPPIDHNLPSRRKQLSNGMEHLRDVVTLEPTTSFSPQRNTRTNASSNPEKRTDPFQFGSRFLEEGDDIFEFNAWDHVETDEAYKAFMEEQFRRQRESPVGEFDKKRINEHPERSWNTFYANNTANFFKDRKWLHQEFPVLASLTREGAPPALLLEVGAGAGNTAFPILKLNRNPGLRIHACDFSKAAVEVIKGHDEYTNEENVGAIEASVWDVASESLPEGIEEGSVDVLLMIFIFSALAPDQWVQAMKNVWRALKPGGVVLFRDYGRGDLAQVRFKKGRWMDENFYVRGDGTRVYFFEEEELRNIWSRSEATKFEVVNFGVDRRMLVNRQRRLKMYRCWMQAVFRKPFHGKENDSKEENDGLTAVEVLANEVAATSLAHDSQSADNIEPKES